jgi:DNA-directed RNA polymerase specialized sigma24 family protein
VIDVDIGALFARATRQAERILGDFASAEDVAAEAVSRLVAGSSPDYLGLIVNGLALDEYDRRKRFIPYGDMTRDHGLLDIDQLPHVQYLTPAAASFRRGFDTGVRALPSADRDAFLLTDVRGLTEREAAHILGTSQPTVHRLRDTARLFLKETI